MKATLRSFVLAIILAVAITSCTRCEECSYKTSNNKTVTFDEICGTQEDLDANKQRCDTAAARANKTTCVCQ